MPEGRVCRFLLGVAIIAVSLCAFGASDVDPGAANPVAGKYSVDNLRIPLLFEANSGQVETDVRYLARSRGYTVLMKQFGPELVMNGNGSRLSLRFRGSSEPKLEAGTSSSVRVNYYRGKRPSDWQTNVPTFERVSYENLYPGIDLLFYGNQRQLEHDFVVAPGADPRQIGFTVSGALSQRLEGNGDLLLTLPDGELRLKQPVAYQEWKGRRHEVSSQFQLNADGTIHFKLGRYNRRHRLVIDPILSFSTYLGGNGGDSLRGVSVFVSTVSGVYVAGVTNSTNLPATTGQTSLTGVVNGYIAKFDINSNALVWLSYFGGMQLDYINSITSDIVGNLYIGGDTTSPDLPLAGNSVSTSLKGPKDGFVAEFDSNGALIYSTYLGGSSTDRVLAVAVDSAGRIDVAGDTFSTDFPVKNPVQAFQGDGSSSDLFITQINTSTTNLPFSTPYGGSKSEAARAIAVDSGGIYVGGETVSTDFPAVNGMDPVYGTTSAFLVKVDPVKAAVVYSDVFGGSHNSHVTGIAVDGTGAYLTGNTDSPDFPIEVENNFQSTLAGGYDAFVSKVNTTGTAFIYSSYLGGSANDNNDGVNFQGAIAVRSGTALVTGYTQSADFPVANPTQGFLQGTRNAFVSRVNSSGTALTFSTFLGGSSVSQAYGISVNSSTGNLYVVGDTTDADFPLVNPFQDANAGGADGFVSVYQQPVTVSDISVTVNPSTLNPITGSNFSYTVSVLDNGPDSAVDNVMLYDTLPDGVTLVSVFPFQGTCSTSGKLITCNLGHFTQGKLVIVSITVTPTVPIELTNTAIVRSDDDDSNLSNNTAVTTVTATFGSCLDTAFGNKGWKGGSVEVETDYNIDDNWDPVGVPTSEDTIVLCRDAIYQPVMSVDNVVGGVYLKNDSFLDLGTHILTANGNVTATGTIENGTLVMAGNPVSISGVVPNLEVLGVAQVSDILIGSGNLLISGNGVLDLGNSVVGIPGVFQTAGSGVVKMQQPSNVLEVEGEIIFGGGSETGLITNGVIETGGDFSVLDDGIPDRFVATVPNIVAFTGNGSTLTLSHPVAQTFGHLEVLGDLVLGSPATVSGILFVNNVETPITISGAGPLSAGGVQINGAVFSQTPLSIGNGIIAEFDNVTFKDMDAKAVQLSIAHDGSPIPYAMTGLQFLTTPTTGKFISVTNSNPDLGHLTFNLSNTVPPNGSAYTSVDANSTVNWPDNSGPDGSVSVTPNPLSAYVGQTINYVVNVANVGTVNLTGVTAVITYTPYNGNLNVTGANCTGSDTIVCTIGNLAVGQSVPINVAVTSFDAKVIQVTGSVSANESDINLNNNTANGSATFNPVGDPPPGTINGTILYSRADNGSGTIWTAAGDGSSDQQVTVGSWPRLSPDQHFIAFHRDSNPPNRSNMYLFDVTAQTSTLIFNNGDYQNGYTFSLDSAQIYFDYSCGEYRMNRDGTNMTTMFQTDCYDDNPRINPSGTKLAFENANAGLGLYNPDGSGRVFIPNTQPGDYMPTWSPDGSRIAFVHFDTAGAGNLFVINPDGSSRTRLSFLTSDGDGPVYGSIAWTSEGSKIVFAGHVNGIPGIYTVSSDGLGNMTKLSITAGDTPNWVGDIVATTTDTADVSLSANALEAATAGNTLPIELTVSNAGPGSATGIQVVANLPNGTSYISGYGDQSQGYVTSCSAANNVVTCNVTTPLPPEQSLKILINVAVPNPGAANFTAQVTTASFDPNLENNGSGLSIQVIAPACVQPPSGMVSWYRAEINPFDYTGAHDGTLVNSPQFVSGKVGSAFSFDGTTNSVNLTNISGNWSAGNQWTVEAWVSPKTTDQSRHSVVAALDACDDWGIVYQNGQFGAVIPPVTGCTGTVFSNFPADLNRYSHVVATSDGTTAKIYVNGLLMNSAPVAANHNGYTFPMIAADTCCGEFFSGSVDEATIYNRALSDLEIAQLFIAGSAGKCGAQEGQTADVAIAAAGKPTVVNGHPTYSVTVTNNGPQKATGVVLTDVLDNFGYVAASASQGSCSSDGTTVSCGIGSLGVGSSAIVSVSVVPPDQGWASQDFHAVADEDDPNPVNNLARIGPGDDSFNTSEGRNVSVQTSDSDGNAAQVTFTSVSRKGKTSIQSITSAQPPAGYRHGTPAAVFDISTTATTAGAVQLAVVFNPASFHHPAKVRLFHMEAGIWVDRTSGVDVAGRRVAGATTSLSPFALFEPLDNAPVANSGGDRSTNGNISLGSSVTLSAAASTDADGDPLTYRWMGPFPEGGGTVTGVSPTVTMPFGTSKVILIVNDGEVDSTPSMANITVADFKLSARALNGILTSGQAATYTIDLSPQFGSFDAPVTLGCGGLTAGLSCSFTSQTITPGTTGSSVTLTISRSTAARVTSRPTYLALWFGLPFGVVVLGTRSSRRRLLLFIILALVAGMIACGGGGGGFSSHNPNSPNTSVVTVTGTSGALSRSITVQVTVNP